MKRIVSTIVLTVLMLGCASMGLQEPRDFGERLEYGYRLNAALRTSAAQSVQTGAIQKADAQHALDITNSSRTALDTAKKLGCPQSPPEAKQPVCLASPPSTALAQLQFANGILLELQRFLNSRKAGS